MTGIYVRWLPLVLLAAGFALAAVWGGLWLGGAVALGRSDVALAIPTLLAFAMAFAGLARKAEPAHSLTKIGIAFTAIVLILMITGGDDDHGLMALTALPQVLWFLMAALLAAALGEIMVQRAKAWPRGIGWSCLVVLSLMWWLASHIWLGWAYLPTVPIQSGRVVMVTGLPLVRWADPAKSIGVQEYPAVTTLRAMSGRPLVLADTLAAGSLRAEDRLLLAHPYALSPEALVEIDRFVRGGGRAVVLADGLSGWQPPHGLGDPRNPPITSLLTPLLDHWGIGLAAPLPGSAAAEQIAVRHLGYRLILHSSGHFDRLPSACRGAGAVAAGQPTIATCRIGGGKIVLMADADLLFAPLWQSAPTWARHLRPSDNLEWLADQLNSPLRRELWGLRPTWHSPSAQ